ncbi:MAG: M48 family metallopeptidase [Tannerella sp.]|jgi:predicted metal-dependent hydrolase|nr:M48 family metallopeptidase [Tannerella sp.]
MCKRNFNDDENIRLFAVSKISWIRMQQKKFAEQLRHSAREFVSGETIYIWGKQYYLQVEYSRETGGFMLDGEKAILTVRKESTAQQRENYVNEVLWQCLEKEITRLLPVWEQKTGLQCKRWIVKYMKTRWGTYIKKWPYSLIETAIFMSDKNNPLFVRG